MAPPLLFDVHVHRRACELLREAGIDAVHAAEEGLAEADDLDLLLAAAERGRVVVTRNYRHFAPLVRALGRRGESFPGVLFLSPAIPQSDLEGHVRAVSDWCARAGDDNPVRSTYGWLGPADRRRDRPPG